MNVSKSRSSNFLANNIVSSKLVSGELFTIGRLGSVEAQIVNLTQSSEAISIRNRKLAWVNAGIAFPTKTQLKAFSRIYLESLANLDYIAKWPNSNIPNQEELLNKYTHEGTRELPLRVLDPVQLQIEGLPHNAIWTQSLKGKRVLVISTFSKTIQTQYLKRENLHQERLLPDFFLETIVPPVTNGATFWRGNYSKNLSNFQNKLTRFVANKEIDLALVSAGAYGLPIMTTLRSSGISSIYMGGSMQLLFGILGNRWREIDSIQVAVTPNWVLTPKENRPLGYRLIEKGSYW